MLCVFIMLMRLQPALKERLLEASKRRLIANAEWK
jgi:hypothetical protein